MPHDAGRATTVAESIALACAEALGSAAVAGILHGSLTLGDFVCGRSDIDLLIIARSPMSDAALAAVRDTAAEAASPAGTRVDLRVVTRAVASAPTPAPAMEAEIVLRPDRQPQVTAHVSSEPDLAVEFSVVRAHGRSIFGPAPKTVVADVPRAWVVAIGDNQLASWEQLADDAAHAELMALTTCRIWRFALEGIHSSKRAAGEWALRRDPSLTAVAQALRYRGGEREAVVDPGGIRTLLERVRDEIAATPGFASRC